MVEVSTVIVSRNRPHQVKELLEDISRQSYPQGQLELIVVDDCSDPAYSFKADNLTLVRNDRQRGAPFSRNLALSKANGEFLLMLDDDIRIISSEFIDRMTAVLKEDSSVAAVFPRKLDHRFKYGKDLWYEFSCSKPALYSGELKRVDANEGFIGFGGSVYLIRTAALRQAQGYDLRFGKDKGHSFREESDLHCRLRKLKFKLYFMPKLEIRHMITPYGGHGASTKHFLFWMAHNHIIFLKKHFFLWQLKAVGYLWDIVVHSFSLGRFRFLKDALRGYIEGLKEKI